MGRLTRIVVVAVATLTAPVALAAIPFVQNPRFTAASEGIPLGWRVEAWTRDLTDFSVEPAPDGGGLARIVNRGPNDARLCQTVQVEPGATYRVTARVKTEGVGTTTAGALIALEPRVADSPDIKGTQPWQTLEVTAEAHEQTAWDICLRLGSYANLNTGSAWFTDVHLEQLSGGTPPDASSSHWPRLTVAPLIVAFRTTSWLQTVLPLGAGLLLAIGLGVIGRPPT